MTSETFESTLAMMRVQATPSVALRASDDAVDARIGGAPDLAADIAWPRTADRPLAFIIQLDCATLRRAGAPDWLPDNGMLFFFYDLVDAPWGFDPADRGSWTIVHDPRGAATSPRDPPQAEDDESNDLPVPSHFAFHAAPSFPGPGLFDLDCNEDDEEELDEAIDAMRRAPFDDGPRHQIAGYPHTIQGDDMERQCQLASNGIYCGDAKPLGPKGEALLAGTDAWRLLLQLDSDDESNLCWCDCGRLYVWIREEDARAGRWDKSWTILQSY